MFCDPYLLRIECVADCLHRALDCADAAADAFTMIDYVLLFVLTSYRIYRTCLGADLTPDAVIKNRCLCSWDDKVRDGICRTFSDTEPADTAFIHVDPRQILIDFWSIEWADLHAHPTGDAPNLAELADVDSLIPRVTRN